MSTEKYYHVRIDLVNKSLFDNSEYLIDNDFENYRSEGYKKPSAVPYDLIKDPNILNDKNGFLKFLDDILKSDELVDFNDLELKKNVLKTINFNCYFLNARYWENKFEQVRIESYNHLPSRKKCVYLCEGIKELKFWLNKLTSQSESNEYRIYEVEIEQQNVFKCDAQILELGIMSDENIEKEANKYWSGHMTENPEIENLYFGHIKILNVYSNINEIK